MGSQGVPSVVCPEVRSRVMVKTFGSFVLSDDGKKCRSSLKEQKKVRECHYFVSLNRPGEMFLPTVFCYQ